jgi:hypothetical protein
MTSKYPKKKKVIRKNLKESVQIKKNSRKVTNPIYGSNRVAMQILIDTLWNMGRLEKIDAARIEICRLLADAVDANPENANLWRQYREAEDVLRTVGANDVEDFNSVIAAIWSDSALRNAPESES